MRGNRAERGIRVTPESRAVHLARRQEMSARIIASPEDFKLCGLCLSIAYKHSEKCSICGAYRFHENPVVVQGVARVMMRFAFPVTAGVVPRLGDANGAGGSCPLQSGSKRRQTPQFAGCPVDRRIRPTYAANSARG